MSDNTGQKKAEALLKGAYALESASDNVEYYKDFAPIYDRQFVEAMGYCYPSALANVYHKHATTNDQPIADIGCGTGLVAIELRALLQRANCVIDGIDISADMLDVARTRNIYRHLIELDLTRHTLNQSNEYAAIVSAGTFTHGHLGLEALELLLPIAKSGALFCIGVNSHLYQQQGFEQTLLQMQAAGQIDSLVFESVAIYDTTKSEHSDDEATVIVFRKQ